MLKLLWSCLSTVRWKERQLPNLSTWAAVNFVIDWGLTTAALLINTVGGPSFAVLANLSSVSR
jgi:hypothetical protein